MPKLHDELLIQPPASLTWKEGEAVSTFVVGCREENRRSIGIVCSSFGIADFGEGRVVIHLPTMSRISELDSLTIGQMKMAVAVLAGQLNWSKITRENLRTKCPRWIYLWLKKCESAKQFISPEDCPGIAELIEDKK